jgi:hypothetical protein
METETASQPARGLSQTELNFVIARRHPLYEAMQAHWDFLKSTYEGGRSWFKDNIFRYMKEGDTEFEERVKRAYRFNHTREVVDLVNKYIFKAKITRNTEAAPDKINRFWSRATRSGQGIDTLIQDVSRETSKLGRIWVVVDNNNRDYSEQMSIKEEKERDIREWAYFVAPQNVLDLSYDDEGELNWILIQESARNDQDPFQDDGAPIARFRLWTREHWWLLERRDKTVQVNRANGPSLILQPQVKMLGRDTLPTGNSEITVVDEGPVTIGRVPVFAADHLETDAEYASAALIDDIAYMDRAVANYLSTLDAVIQDQTFSQLAMPAQGLLPGEDGHAKLMEMGTRRIFTYDGEGGAAPMYLSPDPKQAELIIKQIKQIINEIYHSVGMAGERTKQDNALGIDNSSGVAKAYDFDRINALLSGKARSLLTIEVKMLQLVLLYNGVEKSLEELMSLIRYPETFDVKGIADEFDIAAQLAALEAPIELRREQMKSLAEKVFPRLSPERRKQFESAIEKWDGMAPMPALPTGQGPASGILDKLKSSRALNKESQQGQNNNG